jgi:hypothetical protein
MKYRTERNGGRITRAGREEEPEEEDSRRRVTEYVYKRRQKSHLSPPQGAQPPSFYAARVLLQHCEHISLPESQLVRRLCNVIVQGARHAVLQHTNTYSNATSGVKICIHNPCQKIRR